MKFSKNSAFKPWNGSAFKPVTSFKKYYIVGYNETLELIKGFPELENFKSNQELQKLLESFGIEKQQDGSLRLVRLN